MDPVGRALWFIESHFADDIGLDDIAEQAGVSRFHVTRAFAAANGVSVMRYLRARRLSEAARQLSEGAPDILTVALEARYNSHEAFTRAFREQFGKTPEQLRAQAHVESIPFMEPIKMDQTPYANLDEPRFETLDTLLIAGLGEHYDCDSSKGIPSLWQRFQPHIGHVPGESGRAAYGVIYNCDDDDAFDYIAGVEVKSFAELPKEFARLRIAPQKYAVFTHRDHVSTIRRSMATIFGKWLPEHKVKVADAPNFEKYGEAFDPRTGMGGFEIWVAVRK